MYYSDFIYLLFRLLTKFDGNTELAHVSFSIYIYCSQYSYCYFEFPIIEPKRRLKMIYS